MRFAAATWILVDIDRLLAFPDGRTAVLPPGGAEGYCSGRSLWPFAPFDPTGSSSGITDAAAT